MTGKAVLVAAGIEPEVEDEVADVEAMDKDQSSNTMKRYKEEREIEYNKKEEEERERERERELLN